MLVLAPGGLAIQLFNEPVYSPGSIGIDELAIHYVVTPPRTLDMWLLDCLPLHRSLA